MTMMVYIVKGWMASDHKGLFEYPSTKPSFEEVQHVDITEV